MKIWYFIFLVVFAFSCKEKDCSIAQTVSMVAPFDFYPTEGAVWYYKDSFDAVSEGEIWVYEDTFFLGERVDLESRIVRVRFENPRYAYDTFAPSTRSYYPIWAYSSSKINKGNGFVFERANSGNDPTLSGWIRFDSINRSTHSLMKVDDLYYDIQMSVYDNCLKDTQYTHNSSSHQRFCSKVQINGLSLDKAEGSGFTMIQGLSLDHYSRVWLPKKNILWGKFSGNSHIRRHHYKLKLGDQIYEYEE